MSDPKYVPRMTNGRGHVEWYRSLADAQEQALSSCSQAEI
jgi:hypothetical protein